MVTPRGSSRTGDASILTRSHYPTFNEFCRNPGLGGLLNYIARCMILVFLLQYGTRRHNGSPKCWHNVHVHNPGHTSSCLAQVLSCKPPTPKFPSRATDSTLHWEYRPRSSRESLPRVRNYHVTNVLFVLVMTITRFQRMQTHYGSIIGLKVGFQHIVILNSYKHVKA